jgi:hypothetical protein
MPTLELLELLPIMWPGPSSANLCILLTILVYSPFPQSGRTAPFMSSSVCSTNGPVNAFGRRPEYGFAGSIQLLICDPNHQKVRPLGFTTSLFYTMSGGSQVYLVI